MNQPISDTFIQALTEHQTPLRCYIRSSMGGSVDADDVIQKTNVILWKKADLWDPATPFIRWAMKVARFEILAYYRDKGRDRMIFDDELINLMAESSEQGCEEIPDRILALRKCLAKLKPEHQQMIAARYKSADSIAKIAKLHNKTADGIKCLMLRLRKKLNLCIMENLDH